MKDRDQIHNDDNGENATNMDETQLFCVRAYYGEFTEHFVRGGYVAIGWLEEDDLTFVKTRHEIESLYRAYHSDQTSNYTIGQNVGQIARFLFDIK